MTVVDRPLILGLDFRTPQMRFADVFHKLHFQGNRGEALRSDLTRVRLERLGLVYPEFDYGLALVSGRDFIRLELHAEQIKDKREPIEERRARVVQNLEGIEAPNIEIIRSGILGFELISVSKGKGVERIIREKQMTTIVPASWEAMQEILEAEFPGTGYYPDYPFSKSPTKT